MMLEVRLLGGFMCMLERKCGFTHRHHGTARHAGHKHFARVGAILDDGPLDHVRNRSAVASAVPRQARLRTDIPAGARVGRAGIHDHESVRLCQRGVGRASVVRLRGAGAIMDGRDDARIGGQVGGNVHVEADICGVGDARVRDLREGAAFHEGVGQRGADTREECGEVLETDHFLFVI